MKRRVYVVEDSLNEWAEIASFLSESGAIDFAHALNKKPFGYFPRFLVDARIRGSR